MADINKKTPILTEEQPVQSGTFTRQELDKKVSEVLAQLLKRKDVQQAIENSPITKALKTAGLDAIVSRANQISGFTRLEQFKSYLGPKFSQYEQEILAKLPKDIKPETIKQFEEEQVIELKKVYKQIYATQIQKIAQSTPGIEAEIHKAFEQINKLG